MQKIWRIEKFSLSLYCLIKTSDMIKYRVYICKVGEEDRFIDVKTPEEGLEIVLNNVGGYRIEDVGIQEIDTELENDWDEWFFEHDGLAWDCGSLDLVDGKIVIAKPRR